MPNSINNVRTIALCGQAGSGKTTLAEAIAPA
jgi:DNA replication protein DnaC